MNLDVIPSGDIPVAQRDSNISLYAHQEDASKKLSYWNANATGGPAGLLVLPTGGGKNLTATYRLMQNVLSKGKKILWIAHRYSLLNKLIIRSSWFVAEIFRWAVNLLTAIESFREYNRRKLQKGFFNIWQNFGLRA